MGKHAVLKSTSPPPPNTLKNTSTIFAAGELLSLPEGPHVFIGWTCTCSEVKEERKLK